MLNLLTKTKPWIVASLLVATSVFGQTNSCNTGPKPAPSAKPCPAPECKPKACPTPCPQPCPPTQLCPPPAPNPCCPPWPVPVLNAAYNYPARIMTRCPWDIFFDASFIYWQPIQENMEVAFLNTTALSSGSFCTNGINGQFINMKFKYKPGFKVGIGGNFDYDNWDVHAEYTWFHNTQDQSTGVPNGTAQLFATFGVPQDCFSGSENFFNSAKEEWRLHLDVIDLTMGRWGYYGTKLTLHPFVGGRAAIIHQKLKLDYKNDGQLNVGTAQELVIKEKANSWGVGPEFGIDTNWMIGSGFRMFGGAEADILFTKYTKLTLNQHRSNLTTGTPSTPADVSVKQNKAVALRTHLDLEMGFGWGTYLDCNNWYLDFSAAYGFQVFFDQNMFRFWAQDVLFGSKSTNNGNLYTQGLTATVKLDF